MNLGLRYSHIDTMLIFSFQTCINFLLVFFGDGLISH
jgi:hypothetical protein